MGLVPASCSPPQHQRRLISPWLDFPSLDLVIANASAGASPPLGGSNFSSIAWQQGKRSRGDSTAAFCRLLALCHGPATSIASAPFPTHSIPRHVPTYHTAARSLRSESFPSSRRETDIQNRRLCAVGTARKSSLVPVLLLPATVPSPEQRPTPRQEQERRGTSPDTRGCERDPGAPPTSGLGQANRG